MRYAASLRIRRVHCSCGTDALGRSQVESKKFEIRMRRAGEGKDGKESKESKGGDAKAAAAAAARLETKEVKGESKGETKVCPCWDRPMPLLLLTPCFCCLVQTVQVAVAIAEQKKPAGADKAAGLGLESRGVIVCNVLCAFVRSFVLRSKNSRRRR